MKNKNNNLTNTQTVKKVVMDVMKKLDVPSRRDIRTLSAKIDRNQKALDQLDGISAKIDRNQKALDQLDSISTKIDRNQKALNQIDEVARILRDNEQNLKDLGGLKHRLDTLDRIMVTVDRIAGGIQKYEQEQTLNSNKLSEHSDRLDRVEKHLHLPPYTPNLV